MTDARERIIMLLAAVSLVALAAAFTNSAILYSTCVSVGIGLGFALSPRSSGGEPSARVDVRGSDGVIRGSGVDP